MTSQPSAAVASQAHCTECASSHMKNSLSRLGSPGDDYAYAVAAYLELL